MKKNYLIKMAILLLPLKIFSQLNVIPNSTATSLAQAITGSGVTVTNAALNCGSGASGTFSYSGSNLGISGGIILTTGSATDAANPGTYFCDVANGNNFSDPDLISIDPDAYNDVCILQFDFVPVCNSLSITYVFGSEEYPTYVGSFNDGVGIFLTGPNPSGGNYTAQNIGTLPSGTAVSINNVNAGMNSSYFHDNYTNPNNDIAYDGYTIPITSVRPVTPCSTYHMKIAIADAIDEAFDSGIFIGSNAVSCQTAPSASVVTTAVSCGGNNGTASVSISNYTATPTYSWSPGGQTSSSLSGLSAGTYTCVVGFLTACSTANQTLTATVSNPVNFNLTTTSSPATCSGSATGSATVAISGGTAPYTIAWNTAPTQTATVAGGLLPGTYTVSVHDNSGCSQMASVNVGITNPTTIQLSNTQVCGNNIVLNASSGSAYQWYDTLNVMIPGATGQTYSASNVLNGQHYIVSYKDNTTGCRDSVQINISKYNLNFNTLPSPACHGGNNGGINISPSGTYTFSSYNWNLGGTSTASGTSTVTPIAIANLGAGIYTVSVYPTGNPSCLYTYTVPVTQGNIPPVTYDTIKACNLDTLQLNPPVTPGSTNNWYTSALAPIGTSPANISEPILPVQLANTSYIDTIRSAAGCISVYKVSIKIKSFQNTVSIVQKLKCYNDSIGKVKIVVPRETNGPLGTPYTFTWHYPAPYTSPTIVSAGTSLPPSSTEYTLHAGSYYCVIKSGNCTDTAKFIMANPPKLKTDSIFAYYCPKDSLALLVAASGKTNYQWHPGTTGVSVTGDSIKVPVPNLNGYYVTYQSNGCADTAKVIVPVTVYNAFRPNEMVNIFTPNGDKSNDFFYPFYAPNLNQYQIFKQSDVYELKVYDRWGKLMYETTDYSKPWDGKTKGGSDAVPGSYFYVVKYQSNCGSAADLEEKKGFVELMR
jgi:gliding motility-associated-like protein